MGGKPRVKPQPQPQEQGHVLRVVMGSLGSGMAIYLNGYRIGGSKPWGGGNTIKTFRVSEEDLTTAKANA